MTWGEIQIESLKKMFLNKEDLLVSKLDEYRNDKKYKTLLFSMKQACNEAIIKINSLVENEKYIYELNNNNTGLYDLALLIEDFSCISDIEVPLNVTWQSKSKNIIKISNWKSGNVIIYYEKKPKFIDDTTLDTDLIYLEDIFAKLIPLYIAGTLFKDDDFEIASTYLNEFNNFISLLSNENYANNNSIIATYKY